MRAHGSTWAGLGRLTLAFAAGVAIMLLRSPVWADDAIVIEATKLNPPVLRAIVGERVTFVNRSGRLVHVDFIDHAGRHRVFQVPGQIWATFHQPGLHPYEVHFAGPGSATLRGTVEAVDDPSGWGGLPTCDSLTVMGVCIER
jgi:hypothetical protein